MPFSFIDDFKKGKKDGAFPGADEVAKFILTDTVLKGCTTNQPMMPPSPAVTKLTTTGGILEELAGGVPDIFGILEELAVRVSSIITRVFGLDLFFLSDLASERHSI